MPDTPDHPAPSADAYRWLEIERCRYLAAVLQRVGLEAQELATALEDGGPAELSQSAGPISEILLACATNLEAGLIAVAARSHVPTPPKRPAGEWWAGPY